MKKYFVTTIFLFAIFAAVSCGEDMFERDYIIEKDDADNIGNGAFDGNGSVNEESGFAPTITIEDSEESEIVIDFTPRD